MKRMIAKYPGICRTCGKKFGGGTPIIWSGRGQMEHDTAECYPAFETARPISEAMELAEGRLMTDEPRLEVEEKMGEGS